GRGKRIRVRHRGSRGSRGRRLPGQLRRQGLGGLLMGLRDVGVRKRRPRRRRGSGVLSSEIGVRGSFGGAFAVGHRLASMFDARIHPSRIAILPLLTRSEGRRLNLRYRSDSFCLKEGSTADACGSRNYIYGEIRDPGRHKHYNGSRNFIVF
ncbi:hypothetical protein BHE74_00054011, partial [Ensete ventricosum]